MYHLDTETKVQLRERKLAIVSFSSGSSNSDESVGGVISYFELEAYSEFEILEKRSLGGGCKGFSEPH